MKKAVVIAFLVLILGLSAAQAEITFVYSPPETVYSCTDGPDNARLFRDYVSHAFGLDPVTAATKAGAYLTGYDAIVYSELKAWVAEVAAGQAESTVFSFPYSDLVSQTEWTAEELGVSDIVVNNAVTQEAKDAVRAKYDFDFSAVMDALRAESPYDLYWHDKISGVSRGYSHSLSWVERDGQVYLTVSNGKYNLYFTVAQEYAGNAAYTVDTAKTGAAALAARNANAIVAQYASVSDVDKLIGYKNEICRLTSYNHPAADNENMPYGNPWQMIWVFDGDESTTVVCEGYAKAFQYLCDQTAFSGPVTSYIVNGTMYTETSDGPHMWNIVNMPNGRNYLVDVTNCDSGTIGADDLLFMKRPRSGSYSEGYIFYCGSRWIGYAYNDTTLRRYHAEDLTLALEGETTLVQGTWGTCAWDISDDGVLTIHAGTGDNGESMDPPWRQFAQVILSVNASERIIAPANSAYLFSLCWPEDGLIHSNCTSIDATGVDTSHAVNMHGIFGGNTQMETLLLSDAFVTDQVRDMGSMFYGCAALKSLDLSGFRTANAVSMSDMFASCAAMKQLNISTFDTRNVQDMTASFGMFSGMPQLETLILGNVPPVTETLAASSEYWKNDRGVLCRAADMAAFSTGQNSVTWTRAALPTERILNLPAALTDMEAQAFESGGFAGVRIPLDVTVIDPSAFDGNPGLVILMSQDHPLLDEVRAWCAEKGYTVYAEDE